MALSVQRLLPVSEGTRQASGITAARRGSGIAF